MYLRGFFFNLFFCITLSGFAQTTPIQFHHFAIEDGLANNIVHQVHQDSKGFIWIATEDGLNKYNGYEFVTYRHNPLIENGISGNSIHRIYEDSHKRLWLAVWRNGLDVYDCEHDRFVSFFADTSDLHSLPSSIIRAIFEDSNGRVWIGTNNGLCQFNPKAQNFIRYPHDEMKPNPNSLINRSVWDITEDKQGRILIATWSRLDRYTPDKKTFEHFFISPIQEKNSTHNLIRKITYSPQNELLLATEQGLYLFTNDSIRKYTKAKKTNFSFNGDYSNIAFDNKGNLWLGGGQILLIYNPANDSLIYNSASSSLRVSRNSIQDLFCDYAGNMWIATWYGGINVHYESQKPFEHYKFKKNIHRNDYNIITDIVEDNHSNIWLGNDKGGLLLFNRITRNFSLFNHNPDNPNSLINDNVKALYFDNKQNLWIGTVDGINYYNPKNNTFKAYVHKKNNPNSISNNYIGCIYNDSKNRLWFGTGNGLNLYDAKTDGFFHYPEKILNSQQYNDFIYCILEDSHDILWTATKNGLCAFDTKNRRAKRYLPKIGDTGSLSHNNISVIYEDTRNQLWIGTLGGGLNRFNRKKKVFEVFRERDGLSNDVIYGILEDQYNNLWISTNNGLCCFNANTKQFTNKFTASDGLQSNQFNYHAYCKTSDGYMVFGGINGFNVFNPGLIKKNRFKPQVVITELKLFNKTITPTSPNSVLKKHISYTKEIELEYNQSVVSFGFVALNYIQSQKNQYAYRLTGFEENWNYVGNKRTATYTNLDPGKYVFQVRASNNDGVWNNQGTSLFIRVLPPFWQTWWFRAIIAIVVIILFMFMKKSIEGRATLKNQLTIARFRSEKNKEIEQLKLQFFSNISHEFRTPLTLITGPLEKMLQNKNVDKETHQQYTLMHRNAKRLLRLINQLLDLTKVETGDMKLSVSNGNITKHIQNIIDAFNFRATKNNITYTCNMPQKSINGYFDADKLEKIIYNLLSNAFKFTPENGRITVTVQQNEQKTMRHINIIVSDTGIGIKPEHQKRIFERFYQVDAAKQMKHGTGIGLALTYRLVKIHHGSITLESQWNKGTTFVINIPVDRDAYTRDECIIATQTPDAEITNIMEQELDEPEQTITYRRNNKQQQIILIIEDNRDVRFYIHSNLGNEYQIVEAQHGVEGWERAIQYIPDLIISDIMMPNMNGIELVKRLKADERTSHIPVILLTARSTNEDRKKGYTFGADDYITKPFSIDELQIRIKNLIKNTIRLQKYYSRQITLEPTNKEITSPDELFLRKALQIVEQNIDDPDFGIEKFCLEVGVSRMQLYRKLRALTNQTVKEFIREIRLKRAAQLLLKKQFTVSEIAYKVGFKEISYFRKCFKNQFGLSPTQYIAKNQ